MSETASFVDPVFLARFGLSRVNLIDYFLHPLNPFRTPNNTSNEVLNMQGISIGMLMQPSLGHIPLSPIAAEEAYAKNLSKSTGDQYELLPPPDQNNIDQYTQPSSLYTIRHVIRSNPSTVKVIGVYYVVEGVIYKSPAIRSLMKSNVSRTLDGLTGACSALSVCARYLPSTGYTWNFDESDESKINNSADAIDPVVSLMKQNKRTKRRKILDNRKAGERNEAEEEGLRSSAAIDQILVRLSKNSHLTATPSIEDVASSSIQNYQGSTIAVAEPPSSDELATSTEILRCSVDA
mmetsp:Transcript_4215/g.10937  ORF Transcript_4215/g.10937 Transcript_4215/m.10937 type:complete len:293 (-) Transcript_4215:154-1032(-)|eukprot:CAMPEP_0197184922 /NCGR_PEP_ID=MMETSP1423-20130617/10857_1 /TAXON_ID=476441 /ORGANISM="Pseudo-nitzschia heimii, Strain UNC1101" /LENGTH=292 /DNA_ID=CAMNT_0042635865 /DNA_START=98 /DNA_END=976 /DNA_ORIENTATION=-